MHSRKTNLLRSVDSTDPVLASNSLSRTQRSKKKLAIPREALELLLAPEIIETSDGPSRQIFEVNSFGSDEEEDDDIEVDFNGLLVSNEELVDDMNTT